MPRVSGVWRLLAVFIAGVSFGIFLTVKYLVPPTTEISIGRIKIRGDGNQVEEVIRVDPDSVNEGQKIKKVNTRKAERKARRAARKAQ